MSRLDGGGRRKVIAVIGAGQCHPSVASVAHEIGRLIAERGGVLVTGGSTGVMEAASRGAHAAGGLVIGILPGLDRRAANDAVDVVIPTGMGQLRNGLIVHTAGAVIAVGGEWGTLSEIGFAMKTRKPVVGWHTWELARDGSPVAGVIPAENPEAAVQLAYDHYEE